MEELAPPSRKNTKPVVILWRGSHHAYHDCLRAAIAELAASGGLSRHWLGAPGGPVFLYSPLSGLGAVRYLIRVQSVFCELELICISVSASLATFTSGGSRDLVPFNI